MIRSTEHAGSGTAPVAMQVPAGGTPAGSTGTPVGTAGTPARPQRRLPTQLLWFAAIGVASTVAYAVLYLGCRDAGLPAQPSNAVSLLLTALANTAANRRMTFGIRGRAHAARQQIQGLLALGAGLAVTSAALAALHVAAARPAGVLELIVLVIANLLAAALRFALYRHWVFRPGHRAQ